MPFITLGRYKFSDILKQVQSQENIARFQSTISNIKFKPCINFKDYNVQKTLLTFQLYYIWCQEIKKINTNMKSIACRPTDSSLESDIWFPLE